MIPKAELHVHFEGSIFPDLAKKLAQKNKITLPDEIFTPHNTYAWKDFSDFLNAYDVVSQVIRTPEDYRDIGYEYLKRSAQEGVIYTELMPSPDHAKNSGLSYQDMLEGVVAGMQDAKRDFNIESRIMISGVRHYGIEACEAVAKLTQQYPHPLVTGFGLGGDELNFPPQLFKKTYAIAKDAGLQLTCHAGEWGAPDTVRTAIEVLNLQRIGHGVRSIEDDAVLQFIIDRNVTLEVAPGSNISLRVYPNFAAHPLLKLRARGVRVTLNSDDPPFFGTTIGQEYETAKTQFNLTDNELISITQNAILGAFVDENTRQELLARVKKLTRQ
ncbi:MAG: adenosine deaminase [Legionellales bacterium]|nr:adenosine deaminase [Legionellales bacterium]